MSGGLANASGHLRYHETSANCQAQPHRHFDAPTSRRLIMHARERITPARWGLALAAGLLSIGASTSLRADSPNLITVSVVVTDSQTGQPVNQAHLTLVFQTLRDPNNALKRAKTISYTAKTDAQGRCRFVYIPEGPVKLLVTEDRHQAFGQTFNVSKNHCTLEVKMKPPQPLL
jgi:hypothetical protein